MAPLLLRGLSSRMRNLKWVFWTQVLAWWLLGIIRAVGVRRGKWQVRGTVEAAGGPMLLGLGGGSVV
jgi:hypothetical protein